MAFSVVHRCRALRAHQRGSKRIFGPHRAERRSPLASIRRLSRRQTRSVCTAEKVRTQRPAQVFEADLCVRVLTNHIPLDTAYETLNHYADSSLYKKSSTSFEGMLPVEGEPYQAEICGNTKILPGDELFTGQKHELVQVIDMDFSRARPKSVSSHRDGTNSETGSVIM